MVTLTYRDVGEWRPGHLPALLQTMRKWVQRRGHGLRYVWVAELQRRGAVHYHLLLWLPKGLTLPKPDKQGWWPHGLTRIEWARKPVGYLAKYASKGGEAAEFPKGCRLHGHGGLAAAARVIASWWRCPEWVRSHWGSDHRPRRVRGGFLSRLTGEVLRSPWVIVLRATDWSWVVVEPRGVAQ